MLSLKNTKTDVCKLLLAKIVEVREGVGGGETQDEYAWLCADS